MLITVASLIFLSGMTWHLGDAGLHGQVFHFSQWMIFIAGVGLSEVMISPVMLSCLSVMAPVGYETLFQSLYSLLTGVSGKIAGLMGAHALDHPRLVFGSAAGVAFCVMLLGWLFRRVMIRSAQEYVIQKRFLSGD